MDKLQKDFMDGLAEIFEVQVAELEPESQLESFDWDSLAIVSSVVLIKDLYGIEIKGDILAEQVTVADLMELVTARSKI